LIFANPDGSPLKPDSVSAGGLPPVPKAEVAGANIEETLTFYRLPQEHHQHLKSTNMLERINQELKRRTPVVRIFPNAASCLRLIRALAVEIHEDWVEAIRYLI